MTYRIAHSTKSTVSKFTNKKRLSQYAPLKSIREIKYCNYHKMMILIYALNNYQDSG